MDERAESMQSAYKIVASSIHKCERIQPKFEEGSPQFSLLRNRIKTLKISAALLKNDGSIRSYTADELRSALPPICSIRHKMEKARGKYAEGTTFFTRLTPTIDAMALCGALIEDALAQREI